MRLLGLDPGLRATGWGIIDAVDNRLTHIANGVIRVDADAPLAARLTVLHDQLSQVIATHSPAEAAVEESFVNRNPASALKLGHARGVVLLAPALAGITVAELSARAVKKSVTGTGAADKQQVAAMVRVLLPGVQLSGSDAADALAVAISHAHLRATNSVWAPTRAPAARDKSRRAAAGRGA